MKILIRWAIITGALFVADWLVPGIHHEGNAFAAFVGTAAILGLLNALVRPVLKLLSCPLILLTLGLFVLVINTVVLLIASSLARTILHVGFYVDGFWPAFWGAVVVSIVSVILSGLVRESERNDKDV
jgi:putative membrane protein